MVAITTTIPANPVIDRTIVTMAAVASSRASRTNNVSIDLDRTVKDAVAKAQEESGTLLMPKTSYEGFGGGEGGT